jgi:hypothetical protein
MASLLFRLASFYIKARFKNSVKSATIGAGIGIGFSINNPNPISIPDCGSDSDPDLDSLIRCFDGCWKW